MGEISSTIAEAVRNRATSTALVTYSFFWLAWHWQGIFVAFFTSETKIFEKYGLLKNEYVNQYFFGIHGWETFWGFIIPLLLAIVFIWPLQKYAIVHAYRLEQKNKTSRRKIRLDENEEVEKHKESLINQKTKKVVAETKKVVAETKKVKARAQLSQTTQNVAKTDPKLIWNDELRDLNVKERGYLRNVFRCVYEHRGQVYVSGQYFDSPSDFELGPDELRFADSREIAKIVESGARIELTPKGKFFASKFDSHL